MSASAVHFRGVEVVMRAYDNNKVAPWAIMNGKDILFSSEDVGTNDMEEGAAQLKETLCLLRNGGSQAKFKFCTYKLKKDEDITTNTGIFRSFQFSLFEVDDESMPYLQRSNSYASQMNERMDRIEALLAATVEREGEEASEEREEEEGGIMGTLNGLMKIPQVQSVIGALAMGWVQKLMPAGTVMPGAVGSITPPQSTGESVLLPGQPEKVQQALNVLVTCDPNLGDNLLKIAAIAKDTPKKYATFAQML
jgi:hypothetical protein